MINKMNNKEADSILQQFETETANNVTNELEEPQSAESSADKLSNDEMIEQACSFLKEQLASKDLDTETVDTIYSKLCLSDIDTDWELENNSYVTKLQVEEWGDLKPFQHLMFDSKVEWEVLSSTEEGMLIKLSTQDLSSVKQVEEVFESLKPEEDLEKLESKEEVETTTETEPIKEEKFENKEKPLKVTSNKIFQNFSQTSAPTKVSKVSNTLSNDGVRGFSFGNKKYVQLPIMMTGNWHHPEYGELNFDRSTIAEIQRNILNNELGFEPSLHYGHPSIGETPPSIGFLVDTVFSEPEETLYGIWETNETVYDQILNEEYRYSSSEFYNNQVSKKDGDNIGKVFFRMALTNTPFIPELPRNVALSQKEKNIYSFSMELNSPNNNNMTEQNQVQQEPSNESLKEIQNQLETYKSELEKYSNELKAVKETYEQQLSDANERIKELNSKVRQTELDKKLGKIEDLQIPREQKDKYKSLFEQGSLGGSEDAIMESLEEMSKAYQSEIFTQKGSNSNTEQMNTENKDELSDSPHSKKIKENYEMSRLRRQSRQESAIKSQQL